MSLISEAQEQKTKMNTLCLPNENAFYVQLVQVINRGQEG